MEWDVDVDGNVLRSFVSPVVISWVLLPIPIAIPIAIPLHKFSTWLVIFAFAQQFELLAE